MKLRFAVAGAVIGAGLIASPASAEMTMILFSVQPDSSGIVSAFSERPATSLQLLRGNTLLAQEASDPDLPGLFNGLTVARLELGDRVVLSENGASIAEAAWPGNPSIDPDACAGKTTFGVGRTLGASILMAGVSTPGPNEDEPALGTIAEDSDRHFTVTMERPLSAGQVAVAATSLSLPQANGDTLDVWSMRAATVPANCGSMPPPQPGTTPTPGTGPGGSRPTSTDAQVRQAVETALHATRAKLRSLRLKRSKRVVLPFVFPEPGTTRLELVAKGKVVAVGRRTRTIAGAAKVTVKLSAAARKARKLTLRGTFTPSRAGARPQRASMSVTLRR